MKDMLDAFDWLSHSPLALALAMEDHNTEMTQIEHDLLQAGVEYGPDGKMVQVDTPWAMGLVDEQGVSLVA